MLPGGIAFIVKRKIYHAKCSSGIILVVCQKEYIGSHEIINKWIRRLKAWFLN